MGKWQMYDPVANTTTSFMVNPNTDQPQYQKTFQFEATTAPGGSVILFEGTDTPTTLQLQGTSLSQTQHQFLVNWYGLRHQTQITDDRGYVRWVYVSSLQFTRKMSRLFPWREDWTMNLYVFSETYPANTDKTPPYNFQ